MSCKDYGSKTRLLRVTALVIKCAKCWLRKIQSGGAGFTQSILSEDVQAAEVHWVKEMQRPLSENTKFAAWKHQFMLFIDESGIWRSAVDG